MASALTNASSVMPCRACLKMANTDSSSCSSETGAITDAEAEAVEAEAMEAETAVGTAVVVMCASSDGSRRFFLETPIPVRVCVRLPVPYAFIPFPRGGGAVGAGDSTREDGALIGSS